MIKLASPRLSGLAWPHPLTRGSPMTDILTEELCLENTSEVRLLSQKVYKELFNISSRHRCSEECFK